MDLSRAAAGAEASATLAINARAKSLAAKGIDVVALTVGEPDFDTPDNIKQAAHRAIQSGETKYTAAAGSPELRQAIARKLKRENGLDYQPSQILASNGSKHSLFQIFLSLVDEGDEVLLPAPFWVSFAEQVRICGGKVVPIDCRGCPELKLTPALLEESVTEHTKALVLNSPCNPTGAVFTEPELREIVRVALDHNLWIISDEAYEKLIYDGYSHFSVASLSEDAYRKTITVNSLSKTYAMTGWRIGYAAGPAEIIEPAGRLQSNMTSGPNSIAQKAAIEALEGPQDSVTQMREAFEKRRNLTLELLNAIPGVSCVVPHGAFYAFPNVEALLGHSYGGRQANGSVALAELLLDQARLAVVPGAAFGAEGYLRLSYATSEEMIQEGLKRFAAFVQTRND